MLPIRNGIEVFIYNVNTFEFIFYIAGDIQVSRFPPPSFIGYFPECLPGANGFCL